MSRRIIVPKGLIQNDVTVVIEIPEELADESDLIASPASSLTDNTENIKVHCKSSTKSQKLKNQSTNVDAEAIKIKQGRSNYTQNEASSSNQSPVQKRHSSSSTSNQRHRQSFHKNEIFPSQYYSERFQSVPRDQSLKLDNPINLIAAFDVVENQNYEMRCNDGVNWMLNEPSNQSFCSQSTQYPSQWNQNRHQLFCPITSTPNRWLNQNDCLIDQPLGRCRTPPPCKPQQWVPINQNRDSSVPSFPVKRSSTQYITRNQENLRDYTPNEFPFTLSPKSNQYITDHGSLPPISSSKLGHHRLKISNNQWVASSMTDSNRYIGSTSISSSCQTPLSNGQRLMNVISPSKVVHERQPSSNINHWMLNDQSNSNQCNESLSFSISNSTQQRQKPSHSNYPKLNSLATSSEGFQSSGSNKKRCDSRSFNLDRRNRNFQPPLTAVIEDDDVVEQGMFSTNLCGDFEKNIDNKALQGQLFKKDKSFQCVLNGERNLTRIVVPQLDLDCNDLNGRLGFAYLETAYEEGSSKFSSDFSDNYESSCA
ncbi:uncharacterized protein [Onthophagus taurus]|uniref:uncharacterized protein isoform X2 n=1 Tax=Onthophagus taurus TaxID=166361 RepID=UPI000C202D6F|nr:transcription factor mef2A-like isoform X2 [Onthophagus taurus]